jgi:hypothetical protein
MGFITVWCYSCGTHWRNMPLQALYSWLARCNCCGGYTDGLDQNVKQREIL